MWDAGEGSLTWKQISALCLRLPALYPWVSLGSPASWAAHQPIKGGAWFAHRCRNTPFILPQLFPDYQLKSQGSSHIFFSIYISFVCYLLRLLLIASLCQVALQSPSLLRSGLKASLETLDFLVGYAGSWVSGLGNKWTPSRGSRSTRVLGTWMRGQGLILVSVCVPGDIWRTDDRSRGLVAVLSSVTG